MYALEELVSLRFVLRVGSGGVDEVAALRHVRLAKHLRPENRRVEPRYVGRYVARCPIGDTSTTQQQNEHNEHNERTTRNDRQLVNSSSVHTSAIGHRPSVQGSIGGGGRGRGGGGRGGGAGKKTDRRHETRLPACLPAAHTRPAIYLSC